MLINKFLVIKGLTISQGLSSSGEVGLVLQGGMEKSESWWSGAVIYQLIPRSYFDGNGDGIGDLQGLASRLSYLRWLGVEAIWLTPIYPSPLQDGGYDITDFKNVHPELGDLAAFHRLLTAAHGHGLSLIHI